MKVLIACEESQRVCIEFRKIGHLAYSCDIQDCSGGFPEWHIKDDVKNIINDNWDLIIAHPPCTYLSNVGARYLYQGGNLNLDRYKKGLKAKEFFMLFYNCSCKKVCIENPRPSKIYNLPKQTQIIQPHYFGDPIQKTTYLWLKNLPPLLPISYFYDYEKNWTINHHSSIIRSKTFPGIAAAMAKQWGT